MVAVPVPDRLLFRFFTIQVQRHVILNSNYSVFFLTTYAYKMVLTKLFIRLFENLMNLLFLNEKKIISFASVKSHLKISQVKFKVTSYVSQISAWYLFSHRTKKTYQFDRKFYKSDFSKVQNKFTRLLTIVRIDNKFFSKYNEGISICTQEFSSISHHVSPCFWTRPSYIRTKNSTKLESLKFLPSPIINRLTYG